MVRAGLMVLVLAGMAAGCAASPAPTVGGHDMVAARPARPVGARAIGRITVKPAPYALTTATGPRIQPFAKQHLARIDVFLAKGDAAAELAYGLMPGGFDTALSFDGLDPNVEYTITVKAWQVEDPGVPDHLVEAQVDAFSATRFEPFEGAALDLDTLGGIKLTLKDRDYASRAPGGIDLVEGVLVSTEAPEGIR